MKLSITNSGLSSRFGLKGGLALIKEAGFDGVDFSLGSKEQLDEDHVGYAKEVREYLDELGLECPQTHGPFPFMYNKPLDETYDRFLRTVHAIEATAIIGAPIMVLHSIEMPKDLYAGTFQKNYEFYKSLEPYAKKFGIKLAVENLYIEDEKRHHYHAPGRFSTPEIMDEFMDALDSDVFCICLDTGHAGLCGIEPWMFIDTLKRKEKLMCLHVHDIDYASDTHTVPYNIAKNIGGINWEKTMTSLASAGYNGYLNFETQRFADGFPDELVPDALAFSARIGKYLISLCK